MPLKCATVVIAATRAYAGLFIQTWQLTLLLSNICLFLLYWLFVEEQKSMSLYINFDPCSLVEYATKLILIAYICDDDVFKISNQFEIGIIWFFFLQGYHLCQNHLPSVLSYLLLFFENEQHFFMAYIIKINKFL